MVRDQGYGSGPQPCVGDKSFTTQSTLVPDPNTEDTVGLHPVSSGGTEPGDGDGGSIVGPTPPSEVHRIVSSTTRGTYP